MPTSDSTPLPGPGTPSAGGPPPVPRPHEAGAPSVPAVRSTTTGIPVLRDIEGVRVVDTPAGRVRSSQDLVGIVLAALGIIAVLVLSVYAHATTLGVTKDVQSITSFLNQILQVGVSVLNGLVALVLPVWVLGELLVTRHFRQALEGLGAAAAGAGLGVAATWALGRIGTTALTQSLTITSENDHVVALSTYATAFAALLTMVGPRTRRRSLAWSWNLLWVALGVQVVVGTLTLPGAIVTVLLGRLAGEAGRYALGVRTDRAYGKDLVAAVRQAGVNPITIVRVHATPLDPAPGISSAALAAMEDVSDSVARAIDRHGRHRVYAVYDRQGDRWDAVVFDGDRQVVGYLAQVWEAIRLRGVERRSVLSLREATERAALLCYAAAAAGVTTPQVRGMGVAADSMLLIQDHPSDAICLADLDPQSLTDAGVEEIWRTLKRAHSAGLAHRAITRDVVLISQPEHGRAEVWLTGWGSGDMAATELTQRLDTAQMLCMLALTLGPKRAVATAARVLSHEELTAVAPLLQAVILPPELRETAKAAKPVMKQLRDEIVEMLPEVEGVEPVQLARFSWKTIALATLMVVAAWVILTTLNFDEIVSAIRTANIWWVIVAFLVGLTPLWGAAMTMVGFSPVKVPMWRSILVQTAGCFANLVAPGVVGHAGINYMYLAKKKVKASLGLATVALVQVSQFVVTIVLLVIISLVSGNSTALTQVPQAAVLIIVAVVVAVGVALAIPAVRSWVWKKVGPTLQQVWPRMVWVLGQPKRLLLGIGGNVINTIGYVIAFWACLMAFGQNTYSIINVTLVYLVGNSVGTAVPTPGGLGAVEGAFAIGLGQMGISAAVAASVAVLFRTLTYWARVPLGWAAMRYLQRKGDV